MSKFQLYIGAEKVDLYTDESVSLTETIQNIRDVSKVFTDFTKPFNLPASDVNNKIFKHYYRFNLVSGYNFDARRKVDARIELNTIPYREGKIALEGVDLKKGKPESYRVTFFGNTVNLKDILDKDELSGLSWLNNFNTIYSAADIEATLINPLGFQKTVDSVQYDAALIVPLITNTMRLYYDSGSTIPYTNTDGTDNTALGGNLYSTNVGSLGTDDVHGVLFEDLTYSIKVHLIIKAIQEQYEQIVFSDDFFDLTNGPDTYKNLYMLCQKKEGRIFEDLTVAEKQIKGFPLLTSNSIMQMNNDALLVFQQMQSETILARYEMVFSNGHPEFTAIIKEGSEVVLRKTFGAGSGNNITAVISQQLGHSTEGYTLHIETSTAFVIDSLQFVGQGTTGNQYTSQINAAVSIPLEKEFIITDNLPPIKVIEFLTGLFKMFNLTAYQKDGIIHIKTLESFYNSGTLRDITKYVDPQSITIDKALPYKEIEFKYEDTNAILAKQHNEVQGVEWGAANYVETGDLNSSNEKFEVIAPFSHLKYERINGTNTDIQWGFMADEKQEPYFEKPVLFIGEFVNLSSSLRFLTGKTGTSSISDITDYWMPSNYVSRDATVNKEGIHFDLELSEWDSTSAFTETLFNKYYQFYIAGIFNSSKRLTKIKARLPKKFVVNFTLADTVIINNDRYKINSITTELLSGSSLLELLNETVNDATATQVDTGGGNVQTPGSPDTNVLTLYECDSPNATFESTQTLATLNVANNTRVEDSSGNTYKVTGNAAAGAYTTKSITSTGLTDCPTTQTPPPTYYYGLEKCSDNTTNYRTSTAIGSPTYAITQQVFDGSTKYVIRNATELVGVPSVTISSTPAPAQLSCGGNVTTNYYRLTPCCSGTVLIGYHSSSSHSGTVVYQGQTYVISAAGANETGTIDIASLSTGTCTTYYYSLNSCTDGSIQHYGTSNCSNLNNTQLTYSGTCYSIQNTTNQSGSINLDSLSSCSCSNPNPTYYLLRNCQTAATTRTVTTTTDLTLTVNSTPASASRVQDTATGICYTVTGTTQDTTTYATAIGQVTDLGVLDCPGTPCTTTLYYQLQQCSTGSTSYISGQTTTQISLSTNDMVASGSTSGPRYKVVGTTASGTTVGTVFTVSDSDCPTYYELQQCYTLQGSYRTNQTITDITLSVGDRVKDSCGMPYTVQTVGVSGGGYANVGDVTDLGASGCPSYSSPTRYEMQKCDDSTTGHISLQQTSDVTLSVNDTVTVNSIRYQISGTSTSTSGAVGVICSDGGNNCITPVTPPPQPPASTYYARFITCDDPAGAIISVYSSSTISSWWVISEVGLYECYRWLDNIQGVNPTELNSSNFNFFATNNTAGANCIDCQNQSRPPPPPPPPPAQTCFQVVLYKEPTNPINLCGNPVQRTTNLDASTLAAATVTYTDTDCTTINTTPQYFSVTVGGNYYYWNGSSFSGPYTQNCP